MKAAVDKNESEMPKMKREALEWLDKRGKTAPPFIHLAVNSIQPIEPDKSAEEVKQKYVAGFMFTNDCKNVILIRKKKPAWQLGKLNGVGGKVENNEIPKDAMIREYKEEAGITFDKWDNFLTVEYKSCTVYFFKGFSDSCFYQSETKESEIIEKISIDKFPIDEVIPNLNWIINLALDPDIEHTEAMEEYPSQEHQYITDEEIAKQFPFDEDIDFVSNLDAQMGARWLRDKLNNKEK